MNDGLYNAILEAVVLAHHPEWPNAPTYMGQMSEKCARCNSAAEAASEGVRAWLALPPSEEEIAACARTWVEASATYFPVDGKPVFDHLRRVDQETTLRRARESLLASRAVLARPPEERD